MGQTEIVTKDLLVDRARLIEIVKQVIAELRAKAPAQNVLMLFSGASTGFVAGMETIKLLAGRGHELTVVFTPSAVNIITPEQAQRAGAKNIILPNTWLDAPGVARQTDLVLVPTLSMNTAARLAQGLMDTLISTLVLGSLLAGKRVIAIRDGADPYGNGGRVFGAQPGVATPLKDTMAKNLDTLATFGIELVGEPDFLATVEARLLGLSVQSTPPDSPQTMAVSSPVIPLVSSGGTPIITHSDLLTLPACASISVPPGARFTPLARETANRLKLKIVFES